MEISTSEDINQTVLRAMESTIGKTDQTIEVSSCQVCGTGEAYGK